MNQTAISWTGATWNPTAGCSIASAGCKNCYAMRLAERLQARGVGKYQGLTHNVNGHPVWTGRVNMDESALGMPAKLKTPSRIFVNSMSDLFHPEVPADFRARVFAVMMRNSQHTFQVLTKRPELAAAWAGPWAPNIWMGASVEDARVTDRIEAVRACGARVKFLSVEPLIGPLGGADLSGMDWIIAGGESGPGYRPMPHSWAREVRDLALSVGAAFFFKQSAAPRTELGTALRHEDGTFWRWQQWPDFRAEPVKAQPHRWSGE